MHNQKILEHWEKNRPEMVGKLREAGLLTQVLENQLDKAATVKSSMARQIKEKDFLQRVGAMEALVSEVNRKYLMLPSEDEVPELPEAIDPLQGIVD